MKRILAAVGVKMTLAITGTALTIAVIGAISVVQGYFLREDLGNEVAAQQSTLVTRVAGELDARLNSDLQTLTRLARSLPDSGCSY